ncbi:hypothetical protein AYX13_02471 [Cryptococcus neoformans]|nr:hypothetical protein AYX13_02471 [Cryptococcus neoformans var. grubii]
MPFLQRLAFLRYSTYRVGSPLSPKVENFWKVAANDRAWGTRRKGEEGGVPVCLLRGRDSFWGREKGGKGGGDGHEGWRGRGPRSQ